MNERKISMNRILVLVIFISAITFFISVKLSQTALKSFPTNLFSRIEDSFYAVRYSNLDPNGIYKGSENDNELIVKGNFGYDWGAVLVGDTLYTNEYSSTDIGLMLCKVVKINLKTGDKTTLFKDSIIRGRCASGEIVILDGFASQSNSPKTNSLCKLYSITSDVNFNKKSTVSFFDIDKGKIVLTVENRSKNDKTFSMLYTERTLEEVRV